jgi:hypothetical protein
VTGIVLIVLSIHLWARHADTLLLLRTPKLGVLAMASIFVLTPLFVIGLAWAVQLGPADPAALKRFRFRRSCRAGGQWSAEMGTMLWVCPCWPQPFRSSSRP